MLVTIPISPFAGQKPGTSGLRKTVRVFQQPHYAAAYIQSVLDVLGGPPNSLLVLGGDGRFLNAQVLQEALRIAAANGFGRALVGRGGLLSTPAASHLIRLRGAEGGLILSASHNPGGSDGDFGIKFNVANGGPAADEFTNRVYARTQVIDRYFTTDDADVDLNTLGESQLHTMRVEVIDPVSDYADLMETLIDFDAIRTAARGGLKLRFDAMNAVTGPYAREIFEHRLGFSAGTVIHAEPLPDFGGGHPDPNLTHLRSLADLMMRADAPDLGAASDGDGDRNLIIGRGRYLTPSDSLAVLAANAHLAPGYRSGLKGVARSMPTSAAVDRVAAALGIPCYETPTGWKYFSTLFDAGLVNLCGEESAGTGSDHIREKDGLWAVLLWLNILAIRAVSLDDLVRSHWKRFGRNYYVRHDYEGVDARTAEALMTNLRVSLPRLIGRSVGLLTIEAADDFAYRDPVDGSRSENQGIRLTFGGGSRAVLRLSGTGTEGATLRLYLERYEPPDGRLDREVDEMTSDLAEGVDELAGVRARTGRSAPDVIT